MRMAQCRSQLRRTGSQVGSRLTHRQFVCTVQSAAGAVPRNVLRAAVTKHYELVYVVREEHVPTTAGFSNRPFSQCSLWMSTGLVTALIFHFSDVNFTLFIGVAHIGAIAPVCDRITVPSDSIRLSHRYRLGELPRGVSIILCDEIALV